MATPTDYSKLRPIGNRILVRRLPLPDRTEGGLYLLGREYPTLGVVLAIGRSQKTKRARPQAIPEILDGTIRVGDTIYFHREAIRQERDLGNDIILLDSEWCLGRLRDIPKIKWDVVNGKGNVVEESD